MARRSLLAFPALLLAPPAHAHSYATGEVMIGHPWCLPSEGPSTKAMMPLGVTGNRPEALVDARTPAARAVRFITQVGAPPAPRWDILPRRPVAMRPDGPHLLLDGLVQPLKAKDRVMLTLIFERAGTKEVELWVESAPYSG